MFIKRNRSRVGDKEYTSVLLVQGELVPVLRGPGRPAKDEARKTTVVHRTLASLSKLPATLVELIERYCEAERAGSPLDALVTTGEPEAVVGPAYGPLAALYALARELGIERALGSSRDAQFALFLVLARVLCAGSRRRAARWASTQATHLALGLAHVSEDDLYKALDWLAQEQPRIEKALHGGAAKGTVFLYDVTSSYLEGHQNELAAPGYNRDGKRYKKQIVVGLLTDATGEPVSVQVYEGNRADPTTVEDQVKKLVDQFGAVDVVLVGDRGMLRTRGKELTREHGLRYVTALSDPEIRRRLSDGVFQLELFREDLVEVQGEDGVRYILRRSPETMARHRSRRADQLETVRAKVDKRNALVDRTPRAQPDVSLRIAQRWLATYKLSAFVSAHLVDRRVDLVVDEQARRQVEELDGCYVVVSDVPTASATKEALWNRYGDLQKVERDFRTMKTGLLEIRPIYLRKAGRTRGHALVTMLALKLARDLERRVRAAGLTVREALDRLDGVRLVSFAPPELGLWRLPSRWDLPQAELLKLLPTLPAPRLSPNESAPTPQRRGKTAAASLATAIR